MSKVVIIDADSIAYKLADKCIVFGDSGSKEFEEEDGFTGEEIAGTRLEHHTDEHGTSYVIETSIELAKDLVQDYIDEILASASAIEGAQLTEYHLYLTAGKKIEHLYKKKYDFVSEHNGVVPCFRYEVANNLDHGYKHNRVSKPLHGYMTIMEAMALHFTSTMLDFIEADDICVSIINTYPDKYFLAAMDKDVLEQAVGTHLNYGKITGSIEAMTHVTNARYAIFYKYWQAIVGDPTDGYKGVPGIGKVGAAKLVSPEMTELELYKATVEAYLSKGLGAVEAIATLQLADMTQCKITDDLGECIFTYHVELYEPPKNDNL